MIRFTVDWSTHHSTNWQNWLAKFKDQPGIRALEIGSYEGRSALWFVSNILTHPSAHLTCIDHYFNPLFKRNTRHVRNKIKAIRGHSSKVLRERDFPPNSFHFIYVDGGHRAPTVLEDAVLAFQLLAPEGIMILDDYLWQSGTPEIPQSMPRIAIDSFLLVYRDEIKVLHNGWQVAIEKLASVDDPDNGGTVARARAVWQAKRSAITRILSGLMRFVR